MTPPCTPLCSSLMEILKKKTIREYLKESTELQRLNNKCGNRYHVFNNNKKDDQTQVTELLRKIDEMVEANGGGHYTSKMYEEAQSKIKWEEWKKWGKEKAIDFTKIAVGGAVGGAVGVALPESTLLVVGSATFQRQKLF
uniref:AIG1-type G domain-containing protein n=1 Tax=Esox lucius TaxID=8010 RepID=A0AAY5KWM4_ESOLU